MSKLEYIKSKIGCHRDYPKPGIIFRDFLPVLRDPRGHEYLIDVFAEFILTQIIDSQDGGVDRRFIIIGLESRGFLIGAPLALRLNLPFAPIRKRGKLPGKCIAQRYELEYGEDEIEMQADVLPPPSSSSLSPLSVILVDDLIATGGTLRAGVDLVRRCGVQSIHCVSLIELVGLAGRARITANTTTTTKTTTTSETTNQSDPENPSNPAESASKQSSVTVHSFVQFE